MSENPANALRIRLPEAARCEPALGRRFHLVEQNEPVEFKGLPIWQ
jgi:hypothetical protein